LAAIGPREISHSLLVIVEIGFRVQGGGAGTAGQTREVESEFKQASETAEGGQRMGAAAAMPFKSQMPGGEPELAGGQLVVNGPLDPWRRKPG
jgi:hypothetical protein